MQLYSNLRTQRQAVLYKQLNSIKSEQNEYEKRKKKKGLFYRAKYIGEY